MTEKRSTTMTRTSDRELVFTRRFDAPREMVWQAWTDSSQLARWWGPDGFSITTHAHEMAKGGGWQFTMHGPDGQDYPNHITYLEVEAPARMVYIHGGAPGDVTAPFQTSMTLTEEGGVTLLTMHATFASAADLAYVIKHYSADEGGRQTVGRLAEHLQMLTSEHPEFVMTRHFKAPRALVWKAWTDPAVLADWFGPKGCVTRIERFELKPGGVWHSYMVMPDGMEMWAKFEFQEIVPLERLVWLHGFSDAQCGRTKHPMSPTWPLLMHTTVTFEDAGAATKLTVRWVPYEATAQERQTFVEGLSGMTMGWGGSFMQLDALFTIDCTLAAHA
jgi:uncharacterized protein YndB with AHSA1/START domain